MGVENFMNMFCEETDEVLAGGSNNNQHWFHLRANYYFQDEESAIA
jgi:hypothetical protein